MGDTVHRRRAREGFLVIALLSAANLAWAQAGTGGLAGTIKDSQGAVIPGATITASNTATGASRTIVSNDKGAYSFPALSPGTYTLGRLSGFKPVCAQNVGCAWTRRRRSTPPGPGEAGSDSREATSVLNLTDASIGHDEQMTSSGCRSKPRTSSTCSACSPGRSSFRR